MALKPVTEEFISDLKRGLSPGAVLAIPDSYLLEPALGGEELVQLSYYLKMLRKFQS